MYVYIQSQAGGPVADAHRQSSPTTLPLMLGWPCNKSFGGLLLQLVLQYTLPAEKLCAASLSHASSPRNCTCCCRWTSSGMPQRSWWALCARFGRRALTCSTSTLEEAWALTTTTGEQSLAQWQCWLTWPGWPERAASQCKVSLVLRMHVGSCSAQSLQIQAVMSTLISAPVFLLQGLTGQLGSQAVRPDLTYPAQLAQLTHARCQNRRQPRPSSVAWQQSLMQNPSQPPASAVSMSLGRCAGGTSCRRLPTSSMLCAARLRLRT